MLIASHDRHRAFAMAKKYTAGLLLYRIRGGEAEVFLVHPGGPYWTNKDAGAWSIPKGEAEDGEDLQEAARREFHEETGSPFMGPLSPLAPVRQRWTGSYITLEIELFLGGTGATRVSSWNAGWYAVRATNAIGVRSNIGIA